MQSWNLCYAVVGLAFRPWRVASSVRMSKLLKAMPAFCKAATTFALKPQRGASGLPFMKRSTGAEASRLLMLDSVSAFTAGAAVEGAVVELGALTAPSAGLVVAAARYCRKCWETLAVSAAASAPSISATCLPSCKATPSIYPEPELDAVAA